MGMNENKQEMIEWQVAEEIAFAKARILQQRYLCDPKESRKTKTTSQ